MAGTIRELEQQIKSLEKEKTKAEEENVIMTKTMATRNEKTRRKL